MTCHLWKGGQYNLFLLHLLISALPARSSFFFSRSWLALSRTRTQRKHKMKMFVFFVRGEMGSRCDRRGMCFRVFKCQPYRSHRKQTTKKLSFVWGRWWWRYRHHTVLASSSRPACPSYYIIYFCCISKQMSYAWTGIGCREGKGLPFEHGRLLSLSLFRN